MADPQPVAAPAAPPKVTVYDALVARPGQVTPEQAAADPKRFQPIGAQTVRMVKPDGTMVELPATSALTAAADPRYGYSFLDDEAALHEGRVLHFQRLHDSAFDVGAREAANQFSLGVTGTVEDHTASPDELEGIKRANAAHRAAQVAGGVLGFGANVAATEGLGALGGAAHGLEAGEGIIEGVRGVRSLEAARAAAQAERIAPAAARALEERVATQGAGAGSHAAHLVADAQAPGLLSRLGQATAQGALTGGAYAVPQALAQAYYGDPDHAAESLLWGIGTGGILGLGTGSVSEALAGTYNKLKAPLAQKAMEGGYLHSDGTWDKDKMLELWAQGEAQRAGISKADANKMGKAAVENLVAELKANPDVAQMSHDQLRELQTTLGAKIGEHAKTLDAAIRQAPEELRATLGVSAGDLAANVQSKVMDSMPGLATPMLASESRVLQKEILPTIMSYAKDGGGSMKFEELQQLKNLFSKEAQGFAKRPVSFMSPKEIMITHTRDAISEMQQQAMDQAYKDLPLNKDSAAWLADKKRYGVIKDMVRFGPQQFDQFGNPLAQSARAAYGNIPAGSFFGKVAGGAAEGVGKAIGGGIGDAVAGPLGGLLLGGAAGRVGRGLLGPILAKKGFAWSQAALRSAAESEGPQWLGAALAKNASAVALQSATRIPTLLAQRALQNADTERHKQDVLKDYLGPKANGLSKDRQFTTVGDALTQSKQQPDRSRQEIDALSSLFGFDPRLQASYAQKNTAAIDYLYNSFPRRPTDPQPFSGKDNWKASPVQKKTFLDGLEVVHDPHSVIQHVLHGDLTDAHVRALNTLFPSQKSAIVEQIWKAAYDPRTGRIPEGLRTGLERLTGIPMSAANNYQQVYSAGANQGGTGGKHSHGQGAAAAQNWMTPVQKMGAR